MSEYYIEFGQMANNVELIREECRSSPLIQFDMGQKWLQERNGITRSSFQRTKLGQSRANKFYCL